MLLARLEEPEAPLPGALLDQARARVAEVDASIKDGYARHAAINASANLLWEGGLDAEASRLLSAELERSSSPYYFMLDLAELAQRAGREDEAVAWLERAWDGSRGPATRFQWGYNYLVGLLEMQPEDVATIETAGLAVLGELDGVPDAFHQRTSMRLGQLSGKLLEWGGDGGDRAAVVERLRSRVGGICKGLPANDPGRRNCEAFLAAPSASA
jgi:protein disulfide-isomerase